MGETPSDDSSTVEVVQEGVSYPQPNEKETQDAVQELMNKLNDMVDQATQTCPPPPPPPPPEDDNEGFKRMVRMATIFQSPGFQTPDLVPHPVRWTTWCALCMRYVWKTASLKRDGTMSNVPFNLVCCFVGKTKPTSI